MSADRAEGQIGKREGNEEGKEGGVEAKKKRDLAQYGKGERGKMDVLK